jgi:hypothetical protein
MSRFDCIVLALFPRNALWQNDYRPTASVPARVISPLQGPQQQIGDTYGTERIAGS